MFLPKPKSEIRLTTTNHPDRGRHRINQPGNTTSFLNRVIQKLRNESNDTEPKDLSSWFRCGLSSTKTKNPNLPNQSHPDPQQKRQEEELLGVTEQLIEFVKSLTFDTFNNFPLQGIHALTLYPLFGSRENNEEKKIMNVTVFFMWGWFYKLMNNSL
jgi:hypothetical protein